MRRAKILIYKGRFTISGADQQSWSKLAKGPSMPRTDKDIPQLHYKLRISSSHRTNTPWQFESFQIAPRGSFCYQIELLLTYNDEIAP